MFWLSFFVLLVNNIMYNSSVDKSYIDIWPIPLVSFRINFQS